ncbi:MAG TPA: M23 family metallopeptidase [Egibacteraceae bacterium]|nr:M23 family metallopeptidase [Egibacteraceae bacterium]
MDVIHSRRSARVASPWRRAAVAGLCAAALVSSAAPAAAVTDAQVDSDAEVKAARDRQQAADQQLQQVLASLDEAAAAYENANRHHLLLQEESGAADGSVDGARQVLASAEAGFAERIAQAYRNPGRQIKMAEAVLLSPDVAGALHRVAMIDHVASRGAGQVNQAAKRAAYAVNLTNQHRIVTAGAAGAAQDRQRRADELSVLVQQGQDLLAQAQAQLTQTRGEARERIEEEERLAAWRAQMAQIAAGAAPPVVVDGKVCPVGAPNGFIDSWGYPRSGGRTHKGVDMFAAHGTPLYAVADGVIKRVFTNRLGGLSIDLIDSDGNRYYYAHLSAAIASGGQHVRAGDVIGAVGNTGNARGTPPHLHWQFHPGNGPPVNPYPLAVALCRA